MRRAALAAAAVLLAAVRAPAGEAEYGRAVRNASRPAATPFAHGALPGWRTADSAPLRAFPEGLRPVEYVEFTGPQIVNLGLVFTPRDKAEADWQFTTVATRQQRVFCQRPNGAGLHVELYVNGSGIFGWAFEKDNLNGWNSRNTAVTTNRAVYGIDGPNRRMYCGSGNRWSFGDLSTLTDEQCGTNTMSLGRAISATPTHAKLYQARFWKDGVLALDLRPAVDSDGAGCLFDLVAGGVLHSANTNALVAGPLFRPATPASLAAARRNWYAGALLATNAPLPVVSGGLAVFDTVIIPEGLYATRRDAGEILVADSDAISALVARYRARLAPTNVPVFVEHDRSRPAGRVTALWRVAGEGVWARVEASEAIVRESGRRWHASAELRVLRAAANDGMGTWADFCLPWAVTGLALTEDPALDTPIITGAMLDAPKSPYPGIVPGGKCR